MYSLKKLGSVSKSFVYIVRNERIVRFLRFYLVHILERFLVMAKIISQLRRLPLVGGRLKRLVFEQKRILLWLLDSCAQILLSLKSKSKSFSIS